MSSWSGGSSPSLSPAASPSLLRGSWASDVIHLPSHLEQAIKIKKSGTDPLGTIHSSNVDLWSRISYGRFFSSLVCRNNGGGGG